MKKYTTIVPSVLLALILFQIKSLADCACSCERTFRTGPYVGVAASLTHTKHKNVVVGTWSNAGFDEHEEGSGSNLKSNDLAGSIFCGYLMDAGCFNCSNLLFALECGFFYSPVILSNVVNGMPGLGHDELLNIKKPIGVEIALKAGCLLRHTLFTYVLGGIRGDYFRARMKDKVDNSTISSKNLVLPGCCFGVGCEYQPSCCNNWRCGLEFVYTFWTRKEMKSFHSQDNVHYGIITSPREAALKFRVVKCF